MATTRGRRQPARAAPPASRQIPCIIPTPRANLTCGPRAPPTTGGGVPSKPAQEGNYGPACPSTALRRAAPGTAPVPPHRPRRRSPQRYHRARVLLRRRRHYVPPDRCRAQGVGEEDVAFPTDPALGAQYPVAGAAESGTGRIRDILIAYVRKAFYDVRRASSLRRTRRAPRHIGALRPAEVLRSTRNVIRRRRLASMEIIRSLPAAGTT